MSAEPPIDDNDQLNDNYDTNCYYDVILFAAKLATKIDFSLSYSKGKVYFDNLSKQCLEYFLHRFRSFDITPNRMTASRNNVFKLEINLSDIYESLSSQLKNERSLDRCANKTINILKCLHILSDAFAGLDHYILIIDDLLELCAIEKECLYIIVDKMKLFRLTPMKIHFTSQSNFHVLFNVDEILKITLCNLPHCNATIEDRESFNNSALSTDDLPPSLESLRNDTKHEKLFFSEKNGRFSNKNKKSKKYPIYHPNFMDEHNNLRVDNEDNTNKKRTKRYSIPTDSEYSSMSVNVDNSTKPNRIKISTRSTSVNVMENKIHKGDVMNSTIIKKKVLKTRKAKSKYYIPVRDRDKQTICKTKSTKSQLSKAFIKKPRLITNDADIDSTMGSMLRQNFESNSLNDTIESILRQTQCQQNDVDKLSSVWFGDGRIVAPNIKEEATLFEGKLSSS